MNQPATTHIPSAGPFRLNQQAALVGVLAVEVLVFAFIGKNFFSFTNGLEIVRVSVEIGLLALALTPVILSGGIDLSVGSLMGLSAVVFGKLWLDADLHRAIGFEPGLAVALVCTLAVGALAGLLNGFLITRLRIPPLIVTLGSYSLFRGLAEGLTGGVQNFTIPKKHAFLSLGTGYWFDVIPVQLPIFVAVAAAYWLLVHRTVIGRGVVAIGFSPDGARFAGIPVNRRIGLVCLLSGLTASLAAIIYIAHLGQAKSDAGTGYELLAITAVVLGGTSIFGGRGTVPGTLLGLFVIAVLKNGLQLADLPSELAGIMTGVLLLGTISLGGFAPRNARPTSTNEEWSMKNAQVAAIGLFILVAAVIVAGSNWLLVRSLKPDASGGGPTRDRTSNGSSAGDHSGAGGAKESGTNSATPTAKGDKPITIAMMPKSKGNAYFIACQKGAEEAAKELGVELLWDGPTDPDPAAQNPLVETWITRGVDVIAVAVENRGGISTALRRAREKGIKVITWDSDADPDARDFFVNQATPEGIAEALMDNAARVLNNKGEFAIITASLTAANMIEWQKKIEERRAKLYPDIKMAVLRPCDDKQDRAFDEAKTIMNTYPNVKLIMAICSPAVPGAAEAVKQSGRQDVKVIGLSLPNDNKRYVHEGITDTVILWNTMDLGYLTVYAAYAVAPQLKPGDKTFTAGRLKTLEIGGERGDNILLGKPFAFRKDNIDQFDF